VDYAEQFKGAAGGAKETGSRFSWREQPVANASNMALLRGITDFIDEDTEERSTAVGQASCPSSKVRSWMA